MKNMCCKYAKTAGAMVLAMLISEGQLAMAGWKGAMNGTGFGQAGVNVLAANGTSSAAANNPTNYQNPSAAITINTNYITSVKLPKEASPATVAKIKGTPGYIWEANTVGSNGDSTDNAELESRITIIPADCASVEMQSSSEIDEINKTGTITVYVKGTAGTAIWLRGWELPEGMVPPADDLTTTNNEFIDFLKAHGSLKWDVLNIGPLDQNPTNCTALKIPFSYETSINNLYSVSDGVAKSLPLEISKPADVTVECDSQPVAFPGANVYGCTNSGPITVTYNPPAGTSFTVGIWPVEIIAKDGDGNEKTNYFTVTVTDTKPPTPNATSLPDVTGQCTATISGAPTATDTCSGTITGTTTDSLTRTTQGTSIVTWKFDDGHGNVSTQTQNIIVRDSIAPVIAATGTPTSGVLGMNPAAAAIEAALGTATATDNCGVGTPTASTGSKIVNGCSVSQTRTWTVTDAAGNAATPVSRTVTWSEDKIAPVPDVATLAPVTGGCLTPVTSITPPKATDNCAGPVTGTTTNQFPITASTVITWSFSDGNGNTSFQTQTVNVTALTFQGFYSPVGTANNTIDTPVIRTAGASFPLKWDMFCGTTQITGGTPPVVTIQKVSPTVGPITSIPAEFLNDWHINWPTPSATKNDIYKATVNLPDRSKVVLFVKFK